MSGTLRRPYNAIRRSPGAWVAGAYTQPAEAAPVGILASIQPGTTRDYQLMEAAASGRRINGLFRIYTTEALNVAGDENKPGDIVLDDAGRRLLIIGVQDRHALRTTVSHYCYYASREIEHGTGERTL